MSETHYPLDTTRLTNGRHYITATVTDEQNRAAMTTVVVMVMNPTEPRVELDLVTTVNSDPVKLKYRQGDGGKNVDVTVDARMRGHVRVNGVVQP